MPLSCTQCTLREPNGMSCEHYNKPQLVERTGVAARVRNSVRHDVIVKLETYISELGGVSACTQLVGSLNILTPVLEHLIKKLLKVGTNPRHSHLVHMHKERERIMLIDNYL